MVKPHLKFLIKTPAKWLTKSLEILLIAFGLVIGMCDPIQGQDYEIKSYISSDSLTVGDKFIYVNSVMADSTFDFEPAKPTGKMGEADVLSDIYRLPDKNDGIISYACTLAVYKPGEIEIPSFTFEKQNADGGIETFSGDSLKTEIFSILPADTTSTQMADIREPQRLRGPIWPYIVIPLAIAGLILLGYYLRKRFIKDPLIPDTPPRPPWETAIEDLNNLKIERHHEFGRFKQFYFELSLILRNYIERRYDFPAAESTTYELSNEQELKAIDDILYNRLFEMLDRSDMTKFAKFMPDQNDANNDLTFSYSFVSDTIPKIILTEGEQIPEDENVQV